MFDIGFQSLSRHAGLRHEHQGVRARHAGLLQHRRPGLDQHLHRPEHQDERPRQGDRRQAGAPQGNRPDRHDAPAHVRGPDHLRPRQPLLQVGARGAGVRRPGDRLSATPPASPSTAWPTTWPPTRPGWRSTRRAFPLLDLRSAQGRHDQGAALAAGQPGGEGRLVRRTPRRANRSTSSTSAAAKADSPSTSTRKATRRRRCWRPSKTGWRTGICCRSWRGCVNPDHDLSTKSA